MPSEHTKYDGDSFRTLPEIARSIARGLRQGIAQADTRTLRTVLIDEYDPCRFEGLLNSGNCSHRPCELIPLSLNAFHRADADRRQVGQFHLAEAEKNSGRTDLDRKDHLNPVDAASCAN